MIKANVITNNIDWFNYIKNPNSYLDRKIDKLNLEDKNFTKKNYFFTLLLSGNKEIKALMYCHFRFKQKRNSRKNLK